MGVNVSVKFYPHHRQRQDGSCKIMGRITVNRKKAEFATDMYVTEKDWDFDKDQYKRNPVGNERLTNLRSKIYNFKTYLELEKKEVSARRIRDLVQERDKTRYGLLEYFQAFIDHHKKVQDLSKSSESKYEATIRHLEQFLGMNGLNSIVLGEVDYQFLSLWDAYLKSYRSEQFERKLSVATIYKHHVRLKTILLKSFNEGQIKRNPYANFKLNAPTKTPKYLTSNELNALENANLGENESLERVRDLFLFSCYTGLRYQDAQNLRLSDLHKDQEGQYYIETEQQKTREDVYVPLLPKALEVVKRYANSNERQIQGALLPQISNVKLNTYLKVIQELANIRTKLSHNIARHTFATTVLLDKGVPLEVASKLLGHTSVATTQIYAKVTKNRIKNVLDELG